MFRNVLVMLVTVVVMEPFADAFAPWGQNALLIRNKSMLPRSSRSRSNAVSLENRRERRMAEDKQKGKDKGSSKKSPKSGSDAKWLQVKEEFSISSLQNLMQTRKCRVLDDTPDIKPGSAKVVSGKYKGEELFFALTEYGGKYRAVGEACGRCKFPLINGQVKVVDENGKPTDVSAGMEQDPDTKVAIACPLCGVMFDLSTGLATGEESKGLAQQFVSKLVSQTVAERIKTYEARALSSGAIVVRVD